MNAIIRLKNELTEIRRVAGESGQFCERAGIEKQESLKIRLILEELIVNIISYGYSDDKEHEIVIKLQAENNSIKITIEDDAAPFHPFEAEEPDLHLPLEEREPGGHGIHLVKNFSESLSYETKDGINTTTITFVPETP